MKLVLVLLSIILVACSADPSPVPSSSQEPTVEIVEIAENFNPPEIVYRKTVSIPRSELRRQVSVTKRVAIILTNFTTDTRETYTLENAKALLVGPINGFFAEMSHNETQITSEVFGWYTIDADRSTCSWSTWLAKARQAAEADGIDLSGFTNFYAYFPRQSACSFAGVAQVGGSLGALNGSTSWNTFAHELGHNFGLGHAKTIRCKNADGSYNTQLFGTCIYNEYGDPYDRMGGGTKVHFNAAYKQRLGYISGSGAVQITADRYLNLRPASSSGTNRMAVIDRGNGTYLILEYRKSSGEYESFISIRDPSQGLLVRVLETNRRTALIDMVPSTSDFGDAELVPRNVWVDQATGIRVRAIRFTSTGLLRIFVNMP